MSEELPQFDTATPEWKEFISLIDSIDYLDYIGLALAPPCLPLPQLCNNPYPVENVGEGDDCFTTLETAPQMMEQICANVQTPVTITNLPAAPQYQLVQQSVINMQTPVTITNLPAAPQYQPVQQSVINMQTPVTITNLPAAPQYQPVQQSVINMQTPVTITNLPAAPQYQSVQQSVPKEDIPVVRIPHGIKETIQGFGMLHGLPVYLVPQVFAPPVAAAPPVKTSKMTCRRSHKEGNLHANGPYVKKPPNAFMMFLREQRQYVSPDILRLGSGPVNATLGQKWKSLSVQERDKYYQQAHIETELHHQQYPNWSARLNYGKNKKSDRKSCLPSTRV